ncbi:Lrp/AsnC family transcriptional regulator [Rheinheimera sp.]|uniref:Lrp/AsnC family transcriptional regulator n=1 Tax=Rheinheimera sp. TaxID=1869214 RepID=UPI0027B8E462|nr:Lrp/AsnC family transcriptional regulator [Rheinheimera sp.]
MAISTLDKFDELIIQALQQDARQTVSAIAATVNLSRSAVSERLKRLEQTGVIRGYQVLLQPQNNNLVSAYFAIEHRSARCAEIIPKLQLIPEIRRCHGISGETDLMLFVEAASMARLHQIRELLDADPAIEKITTHMVLSEWINLGPTENT